MENILMGVILTDDNFDAVFDAIANGDIIETEEIKIIDDDADFWAEYSPTSKENIRLNKKGEKLAKEIEEAQKEIEAQKSVIVDWSNRKYKENSKRVQSKFDTHNETGYDYSITSINNKRKANVIKSANMKINELEAKIKNIHMYYGHLLNR